MKTVYSIVAFVAVSILFVSCGKSGINHTFADYVGTQKAEIRENISKEESFALADTIDFLVLGIIQRKEQDKYKDITLKKILKEFHELQAQLAPRRKYLDVAVEGLKSSLKDPESLVLPTLALEDNDEFSMESDLSKKDDVSKIVRFKFKAKSGYGILVSGEYKSYVTVNSETGELKESYGLILD